MVSGAFITSHGPTRPSSTAPVIIGPASVAGTLSNPFVVSNNPLNIFIGLDFVDLVDVARSIFLPTRGIDSLASPVLPATTGVGSKMFQISSSLVPVNAGITSSTRKLFHSLPPHPVSGIILLV